MSYQRVIPRDLFNEGNLLKCYGQLYLNLEKMGMEECLVHTKNEFRVNQMEGDGSLTIMNVWLKVRGVNYYPNRPLNSRLPYPLYLYDEDGEIEVFNDDGSFTQEMIDFLMGES